MKKATLPKILILQFALTMLAIVSLPLAVTAQSLYETKAKHALLIDYNTGTILFSKAPDVSIPPASLAKLMTAEVAFHAIKQGALSMEDKFVVSEDAWRRGGAGSGGSTMFAKLGSEISIADLLRGIIIQSANDGAIILAEGMSGSEANFALRMTQRAQAIGLSGSSFATATGLPTPPSRVTLFDMLKLAEHLFEEYPELYRLYSEPEFEWNKINQRNRNPLLRLDIGADGLKTGFTEESGYAIVASGARDGRRVFLAMSGLESKKQRSEEARKLLDWGLRAFDKETLFSSNQILGEASIFGGSALSVPLVLNDDLDVLIPLAARDRLKAQIVYKGPLNAPVTQGQEVGTLEVYLGESLSQRVPIYAGETVEKGAIFDRALSSLRERAFGWMR